MTYYLYINTGKFRGGSGIMQLMFFGFSGKDAGYLIQITNAIIK
jgi:hypothetical protein